MADLAGYLRLVVQEDKEFPPPSVEQVIAAVQWAFDGLTLDEESSFRQKPEEGEVHEPEDLSELSARMDAAAAEDAAADDVEFAPDLPIVDPDEVRAE